jgi:DedD protein
MAKQNSKANAGPGLSPGAGAGAKAAAPEAPDLKRKLVWRMGFAGLMIVALLATLAVFDHLSTPDEPETPAPRFTEPVPVTKKEITQPVKPAEPVQQPVSEGVKVAGPEPSAAPPERPVIPVEAPPPPVVSAQPVLPRPAPIWRPAPSARHAAPAASTPGAPVAAPATSTYSPPVERRPPAEQAPVPRVPESFAETREALAPPRLFSGYALQAGVFSDPRLAEELHARLTLNGIPSTLETRVQVGPFKSREEAEAARLKMKALGIDAVLLPPPKAGVRR